MLIGHSGPVIGYIMMGGSASLETELHRHLPEGVEIATTRVPFHDVTYAGLLEMIEKIPDAARILAEARPNVIAVTNFIGSCIRGQEMVNLIQQVTGIPAVVPALEYVSVLRAIGAKRIALASCFDPKLRMVEQLFFDGHQIELGHVIELEDSGQSDPFAISQIDYIEAADRIGRAVLPPVDALVVDLPLFRVTPRVEVALERHRGIPVLTLAQVLLWSTFQKVGAPRDGLYLSKFLEP